MYIHNLIKMRCKIMANNQMLYNSVRKDTSIVLGIGPGKVNCSKFSIEMSKNVSYVVKSIPGTPQTVKSPPPSRFGDFTLEILPTGIIEGKIAVLGPGMIIRPQTLVREFASIEKGRFIEVTPRNLKISDRATLIVPPQENLVEMEDKKNKGNTNAYLKQLIKDKLSHMAIKMIDIVDGSWEWKIKELIKPLVEFVPEKQYHIFEAMLLNNLRRYEQRLSKYVCNTEVILAEAIQRKEYILFEGGYSFYDSATHGDLNFSTPIETDASAIMSAGGIGPLHADYIVGVFSPFTSVHDDRYMPTDITNEVEKDIIGNILEGKNHSKQTKYALPDLVMLKHAAQCNGINCLAIDRLDIIGQIGLELGGIKVCVAYDYIPYKKAKMPEQEEHKENEGEETLLDNTLKAEQTDTDEHNIQSVIAQIADEEELPQMVEEDEEHQTISYVPTDIHNATPIFHEVVFNGWAIPEGCKRYKDLPTDAIEFLKFINQYVDVPISYIGTGPEEEDLIMCPLTVEDFSVFLSSAK